MQDPHAAYLSSQLILRLPTDVLSGTRELRKRSEAVDILQIRCISTVSKYHESFSWRIAFVARAFLGAGTVLSLAFSVVEVWRFTLLRSLAISMVLGLSRWNSSSNLIAVLLD